MKIFYSPEHQKHDPPFEGYNEGGNMPSYERASRAEIVHAALQALSWAGIESPPDFGPEPIIAVHGTTYLEYLRLAYDA